jgi:hypothetical protein
LVKNSTFAKEQNSNYLIRQSLEYVSPSWDPFNKSRHVHSPSFIISPCKAQQRQESHFPSTIFDWNRLPRFIVKSCLVDRFVATYGWSRSDNLQSSPVDNWNIRIRFGVVQLLVRLTGPALRSYYSCIMLLKFLIGRWDTNIKPFFFRNSYHIKLI